MYYVHLIIIYNFIYNNYIIIIHNYYNIDNYNIDNFFNREINLLDQISYN